MAWDPGADTLTSEAMSDASLEAIALLGADGRGIPGTVTSDGTGAGVIFLPDAPLEPGTTCVIEIPGSVEDLAGNRLGEEHRASFTTSGGAGKGG